MDHAEIIKRLKVVRETLMASNGTINRNVSAVTKAINIIKFSKNTHYYLLVAYLCGFTTSIVIALLILAIFGR